MRATLQILGALGSLAIVVGVMVTGDWIDRAAMGALLAAGVGWSVWQSRRAPE